ncbi:MAG: low affinity iron permease family protein [Gemmatimonadota bacterium]
MRDFFTKFAKKTSDLLGKPWAFLLALLTVIGWALSGKTFHYSETWQLVINTGTTIITFLMVFLIQNTQNREMRALHIKLDELIHATKDARDELIDLEDSSEEILEREQKRFKR